MSINTGIGLPDEIGITVEDSGTEEGQNIRTLNFGSNLAVSVTDDTATVDGSGGGGGASTFVGLTDTPVGISASQYVVGNAAGNALEFVSPLSIDGTIDITANVTITNLNSAQYNRRLWQITGGSFTVTIAEGSNLTFFGLYVRRMEDTGTIAVTGTDSRIGGGTDPITISGMQSSTFFAIRANRYNEIYNNFRPENFTDLGDTPDALGTSGQTVAVNTAGTALEFVNPPTRDWTYNEISTTQPIGTASKTWNRFIGDGQFQRTLPAASQISAGWYGMFQAASEAIIVRLSSTAPATTIVIGAGQTVEVLWTGSNFHYSSPTQIRPHTPALFTNMVIMPSTSYPIGATGPDIRFTTTATALDMNTANPTTDLLNRTIQFDSTSTTAFSFSIPVLLSTNFTQIPRGSGYAFINNSSALVTVSPQPADIIVGSWGEYTSTIPAVLYPGASLTIRRGGATTFLWVIASQAGTIVGNRGTNA